MNINDLTEEFPRKILASQGGEEVEGGGEKEEGRQD